MNIYLGNLSVEQIEQRLGIEFPKETREFMKKAHCETAENIPVGQWHCFDMPFNMMCGDMETASKIFNSVKDKSSECKEVLRFSLSKKKEKAK